MYTIYIIYIIYSAPKYAHTYYNIFTYIIYIYIHTPECICLHIYAVFTVLNATKSFNKRSSKIMLITF